MVEGTWFDELGALSELSGVTDDVTGESFELLPGAGRGSEHDFSTSENGHGPTSRHQTSFW